MEEALCVAETYSCHLDPKHRKGTKIEKNRWALPVAHECCRVKCSLPVRRRRGIGICIFEIQAHTILKKLGSMPLHVAHCAGINSIRSMQQRPLASSQGFLQRRLLLPAELRWTNERLPLPGGQQLTSLPFRVQNLHCRFRWGEKSYVHTYVEWSKARQTRKGSFHWSVAFASKFRLNFDWDVIWLRLNHIKKDTFMTLRET